MPGPARRRIDFTRLPAAARYGIALAVLVVVVALVLLVRAGDVSGQPAGWYTLVVRVGAVVLLAYVLTWLVRRVLRYRRR